MILYSSHEGSEMGASTSENDDDGCKCGDKCTCDPCTCEWANNRTQSTSLTSVNL